MGRSTSTFFKLRCVKIELERLSRLGVALGLSRDNARVVSQRGIVRLPRKVSTEVPRPVFLLILLEGERYSGRMDESVMVIVMILFILRLFT